MKRFLSLLVLACCTLAHAADTYYMPDEFRPGPAGVTLPWEAGVKIGVPGRAKQYREGVGAYPIEFTITSSIPGSSYVAAGTLAGQGTGGVNSTTLTLDGDGTGWAVNQGVSLGAIVDIDVTAGASTTGKLRLKIHRTDLSDQIREIEVSVASGDSTEVVAGKIATQLATSLNGIERFYGVVDAAADQGGGVWRVRVYTDARAIDGTGVGTSSEPFGYTATNDEVATGVTLSFSFPFSGHFSRISAKSGNVLTLATACPTTLSKVMVSHDDSQAFIAADAAVSANNAYSIPAGTYRCEVTGPSIAGSNRVARGAGKALTFLQMGPYGGGFRVGASSAGGLNSSPARIESGKTKGSTSITLETGGGANYSNGDFIGLKFGNDYSLPVVHMKGNDIFDDARGDADSASRVQMVRINTSGGVVGDTLNFSPPLAMDYSTSYGCTTGAFSPIFNAGLEGFTVNARHYRKEHLSSMDRTYGCWIHDVEIRRLWNFGLGVYWSLKSEITRSFLNQASILGTSNHWGISLGRGATCVYVEDCQFTGISPLVENGGGATWCAFGYCFFKSTGGAGEDIITHSAHPNYILYEGCYGSYHYSDGYHGSESHRIMLRNYTTGIRFNRFSRKFAALGNLIGVHGETRFENGFQLGYPQFHDSYTGTSSNNDWSELARAITPHSFTQSGTTITTSEDVFVPTDVADAEGELRHTLFMKGTWGTEVVEIFGYTDARHVGISGDAATRSGTLYVWPAPTGDMLQLDYGVDATLLRAGNYNYYHLTTEPEDSEIGIDTIAPLSGNTLPVSFIYGSKPELFTDAETEMGTTFAWPPIDPLAPGGPQGNSEGAIPAGLRFIENDPPSMVGGGIGAAGNRVSVTLNKPYQIGAGGTGGWVLSNCLPPTPTLTYLPGESSATTLVFQPSRVILEPDAEQPKIAYTQPGDGIEDDGGTNQDLLTFSARTLSNASTQTGTAAVDVMAIDPVDTDSVGPNSEFGIIVQKLHISQAITVSKLLVYVVDNPFSVNLVGYIYDSDLNLISTATNTPATSPPRLISFSTEPVLLTVGDYYIAIDGGGQYAYLNGSSPADSYQSFDPFGSATIGLTPAVTKRYAFGVRGNLVVTYGDATVSGTVTAGTTTLP